MGFPPWVIGIIIIVLIISLSTTVYFVFRKKIGKKRAAVGAQQDEEAVVEKSVTNPSNYPAITPLYNIASSQNSSHLSSKHGLQSNQSTLTEPTTVPSSPYTAPSAKSIDEKRSINPTPTSNLDDTASSVVEMDEKPSFPESPKINLPLPPPSSSFFADKMELDSTEAHDLYQAYLSASQNQDAASVDLDEGSKLSLANIQQKAANFRSSIYQSLRRKSIYNKSPPLGQFLDAMNSSNSSIKSPVEMSRRSSSTSSRFPKQHSFLPPSPRPDSPATLESFSGKSSNNSSKKSLVRPKDEEPNSNKIMIDTLPHESYFSLPMTPVTPSPIGKPVIPQSSLNVSTTTDLVNDLNQYNNEIESEEEEEEEDQPRESEEEDLDSAQKAASAARKCIRSASRKSKTLSMIITDEDAQAMFTSLMNNGGEDMPSAPDIAKYATVRNKPVLQKIDTFSDSLSMKRQNVTDIKKWSSTTNINESIVSGTDTVSGKKSIRVKNQLKSMFGGDDETGTISKKSSPAALKDLFAQDNVSEKESPIDRPLSIITTSSNVDKITAPSSPITVESPCSSKNNTLVKSQNNVDTIRKMLQTSWSGNSIKESMSNSSLTSGEKSNRSSAYMGSVGSSFRPVASPVGSVNPRLQNQHLISMSLNNSQIAARARPSMPSGFMSEEDDGLQGPEPTVSFSTSTVLTMIPAEQVEEPKKPVKQHPKKSVMGSLMGSRQARQPSKLGAGLKGKTPAQIEREKYLKSQA